MPTKRQIDDIIDQRLANQPQKETLTPYFREWQKQTIRRIVNDVLSLTLNDAAGLGKTQSYDDFNF